MRLTAPISKLILAAFVFVVPATALGHSCDASIKSEIERIGISESDIEKISVDSNLTGDNRLQGYNARVSLKGKKGTLVIQLHNIKCMPSQVYTRGGLAIDGVKSF
jgi:hypothetical protein